MTEDVRSITPSRLVPSEVARRSFSTVRRGFDPQEIRSYLELVARELAAWEHREEDLRRQLAEAEELSRHPVIDEATLTTSLGQQSAQVLRDAHEESARITREAEEVAASLVREAQGHAAELQVTAESAVAERMAQADLATGSVLQEAEQDAARILDGARSEGEAVVALARRQGQDLIEQAQETRRRVLADMAQRRRAMTIQIEQFRAARDELAASVQGVRHSVDRIVEDLDRADDSARAAAAEVARRHPAQVPADEVAAEVERAEAALDAEAASAAAAVPATGGGSEVRHPRFEEAASLAEEAASLAEEATSLAEDAEATAPVTAAPPPGEVGASDSYGDEAHPDRATDPFAVAATAGPSGETEEDRGEVRSDAVEGLFARLRASQTPEADHGEQAADTVAADRTEDGSGTAGRGTGVTGAEDAAGAEATERGDGEEEDPDGPARARAADLLDPVVAQLARRMKRALQDDQNALLDRLRSGSDSWSDSMLAPEDEERARYVEAATPALHDAAAAGIAMARELRSGRGRPPSPEARAVTEAAEGLAGTVVTMLRRRLTDDARGTDSPADRVNAAFREWRGERIERLVGDCALGAFSDGVLAASSKASGVRWLAGGSGPACADCDDNALAGAVAPGDEFPTGHRHPPAHAGCRCVLVPTPD